MDLQSYPASLTTVTPSLNLPPGASNLLTVKVIAELWNSMSFPSIAGSGRKIFMGQVMDKTLYPSQGGGNSHTLSKSHLGVSQGWFSPLPVTWELSQSLCFSESISIGM